ncbi:degT/DnrJ/EryC1/StrS aminotransferase family protein [Synechococcus sp. BIOS-U3-1]|nr:degT/DnrJ/EryC1/StrS aminotransferase family protein [Synechococcus sp. BIOS-U3-1]
MRERESQTIVILPCNICFQVLMAIWQAKVMYEFIDTDINTGNMSIDSLSERLRDMPIKETKQIILFCAHINGIVQDMGKIKYICDKYGVFILEDCAQSVLSEYRCKTNDLMGSYGDFAVYSFGSSKQINLGGGGLIKTRLSNFAIKPENKKYNSANNGNTAFRDEYYRLLNLITDKDEDVCSKKEMYRLMLKWSEYYTHNGDPAKKQDIERKLQTVNEICAQYKKTTRYVTTLLKPYSGQIRILDSKDTDVLWRFSILMKSKNSRDELLQRLWACDLSANKLYPSLPLILGFHQKEKSQATDFTNRILNFPINNGKSDELKSTIKVITGFLNYG